MRMIVERRRSPHTNSQRIAHTRRVLARMAAVGAVAAASGIAAVLLI